MVIPWQERRGQTTKAKELREWEKKGKKIWKAPIPLEYSKSHLTSGRNSDATSARLRHRLRRGNTRASCKVHEERAKGAMVLEAARGKPTPVDDAVDSYTFFFTHVSGERRVILF